ncbi:hypothetical protein G7K_2197-t1 [Saitoella complicata NRRL Y-17804]|uniref:Fatty acid hydroxylase domain-containing protein n=2 Tax=Saitoella complicata (strain BCRC 22490 / CBS 7301 / JCM 7358 / NBRC 10748 / NRRL Y-17804) TaxID=698492 RepID=A0A0E9NDT8_SAICN|nr:hypothetical protein G7K_2197-t1 [Saitoella complicata NRRL Y-17804]
MDIILDICDTYAFDYAYAKAFPVHLPSNVTLDAATRDHFSTLSSLARDNAHRQYFSLFMITWIFGILTYFMFASLSYVFIFDHDTLKHPKYLKNQVWLEIKLTLESLPQMAILTAPWFLAEVRGYSKLYMDPKEYGLWYMFAQFPLFIMFTDCFIYLIHRGLHHPLVYKRLHKPHHKWIVPTPYASHAFHPLDGYAQSLPYHIFPFIFPLHKISYIALFTFINIWTILIHDGEFIANNPLINGAACHTIHHLYFNHNYGQFTTLWDRLGASYRKPEQELFEKEKKMSVEMWKKEVKEMEKVQKEVEGDADDRQYLSEAQAKKTI